MLVAIIGFAAPWPDDPMIPGVAILSFTTVAVCISAAIAVREPVFQSRLNRRDEAAALLAVGFLGRLGSLGS
jgi:hypothetical protein